MENRYIVSKGLEKIYNPAVKKIVGGFEFNSTAIAFSVAPIVNAANRMGENETAMNAFLEDNNKQVLAYVKALKKCKEEQNQEVERLLPNVYEQCEKQKDQKVITVYIDTQYGIAGLLGNKLLEKYQKPILVLKDVGSKYTGSMRAVGVDDFRKICNDSGYAKADGHELASGIQIKKSDLNNFLSYVETNLPEFKEPTIDIDIQIDVEDITRRLVENIKKIDRISGTNFKPVRAYMDNICDYEIGQMSDYRAIMNTNVFVSECEVIVLDRKFKIPSVYKDKTYKEKCKIYKDILNRAYAKEKDKSKEKADGIRYEAKQVMEAGVVDYFLTSKSIIDDAVNNEGGILTTTSRGSAASFITNKLLGLTTVDRFNADIPIYPERFLTKERVLAGQMPDIDMNVATQGI